RSYVHSHNNHQKQVQTMLTSTKQSNATLRHQVVIHNRQFHRQTPYETTRKTLETEKNPESLSTAIRAFGGYAKAEVQEALLKFLNSESYRNELADAAIAALRSQDDPASIAPLLDSLSKHEAEFTSRGFGQGLTTVAYL